MGSRKMIPHSSMLLPFPLRIWEAWDTAAVHRAVVRGRIKTYNRKVQNVNKSNNLSESTGKTVNEKTSRFRLIFLSFYCMFDII